MTAVWDGRWAELARRVLAKHEATALNAIDDLMPVLVFNDPAGAEFPLLRRERPMEGMFGVAGGAIFAGGYLDCFVDLTAPPNLLVVVDEIIVRQSAAGFVSIAPSYTANLAAGSPMQTTDTRGGAVGFSGRARLTGQANAAAIGTPAATYSTPVADTDYRIPAGYVLRSGSQLLVRATAVGTTLTCIMRWRERTCDPAESSPSGA